MPVSFFVVYVGGAGLFLGAFAFFLHCRNRYRPAQRFADVLTFLGMAAALTLAPLVGKAISPPAKAAFKGQVRTKAKEQKVVQVKRRG